ncbi:MAG TPA: 4'-phosphopantetheinyl transferase superfamily protein [Chromatiaceae bacterium]|nr:4'-phosphopantetheinyl transferase superfamily protein [Chromatiaceae bacterium]
MSSLPVIDWSNDFPPSPDPGQIHVWRFFLDSSTPDPAFLSDEEQQRLSRFSDPGRRRRWLNSRLGLRKILADYLQRSPRELEFSLGARGKPSLAGGELSFNLSHGSDLALLAVSSQLALGIDLEPVRGVPRLEAIARRMFSPEEVESLLELEEKPRLDHFFRLWTELEARQKLSGEGLFGKYGNPCQSFTFQPTPGYVATLAWPANHETEILFFKRDSLQDPAMAVKEP